MIIELQDGDILTYKYNGITVKLAYDSSIDGKNTFDTDNSSVLEISRKSEILYKRANNNTLLDSHK